MNRLQQKQHQQQQYRPTTSTRYDEGDDDNDDVGDEVDSGSGRQVIHQQQPTSTSTSTSIPPTAPVGGASGTGLVAGMDSNNNTSSLSPLEQDVLDEYSRLLRNMNHLSSTLSTLSQGPMTLEITEGLRLLERKVASVYTLMKASVYSIVLQQGHLDGEEDSHDGGGTGGGREQGDEEETIMTAR